MKRIAFILLLLCLRIEVFSQVNKISGRAEMNFPLFSYSDQNRLALAVSLNYVAGGGVKVNETASDVGLGWELQSGGVISRQQIGEPDDQFRPPTSRLLSGYLYSSYPPGTACSKRLGWIPLTSNGFETSFYLDADAADKEQDIFHFRFGGQTGSFLISKQKECVSLTNSRLKISLTEEDMIASNIVTRISKFTITTDEGIQYVFSEKQLSRVYEHRSTVEKIGVIPEFSTYGSCALAKTGGVLQSYSIVTDWYLSEIRNPLTNKSIVINYEGYNISYLLGRRPVFSKTLVEGNWENSITDTRDFFMGVLKRVTSIVFPDDKRIEFEYNTYDRVDLPGSRSLNRVLVKQGSNQLFGFQFYYKYFSKGDLRDMTYAFPQEETAYARMCLASFNKFGASNMADKPYEFSYYQGPGRYDKENWVPPRNSIMQDYFGYYNNFTEGPYEGSDKFQTAQLTYHNLDRKFRTPRLRLPYNDPERGVGGVNLNYVVAKNGALKKVGMPNGGSVEFDYEPNTAGSPSGEKVVGGVRVKKVIVSDGIPLANNMVTTYKYVLEDGSSSGQGYEAPVFSETQRAIYQPPSGTAVYRAAETAYSLALQSSVRQLFSSYRSADVLSNNSQYYQQKTASAIGQIVVALITYVIHELWGGGSVRTIDTDVTYDTPFGVNNALPFFYSRVEEYIGTPEDNVGKTVYEYTSFDDYPVLVPRLRKPFSGRPRVLSWAYGLPKRISTFNKAGQIVNETYNKYLFYRQEGSESFAGSKCAPVQTYLSKLSDAASGEHHIRLANDYYRHVFGRAELQATYEKKYDLYGNFRETKIEYIYDSATFLLRKAVTTNDKGERIEKRIYYPTDYEISGALALMKTANIVREPVSNETWVYKSSSDARLVDMQVNEYAVIPTGDVRTVKKYRLQSSAAVSETTMQPFNKFQLIRNSQYLKESESFLFNEKGMLAEVFSNNRIGTNIYDDFGSNAIAGIEYAALPHTAYSSFEASATGNWNLVLSSGTPQYMEDISAPTGRRCLSLGSINRLEKQGLDPSKEYTVSYWSRNGNVVVTGGTLANVKIGATINGWTLQTGIVSGASSIAISGNALVDEARLHPVMARMKTITYNELGSISSMCAVDHAIVKYEYDDLGRLKFEKDQHGNILRYNEYNYKTP